MKLLRAMGIVLFEGLREFLGILLAVLVVLGIPVLLFYLVLAFLSDVVGEEFRDGFFFGFMIFFAILIIGHAIKEWIEKAKGRLE